MTRGATWPAAAVALAAALGLAACPKGGEPKQTVEPTRPRDAAPSRLLPTGDAGSAAVLLPDPPPLPAIPTGLPAPSLPATVTPAAVALGELLFHDPRLSSTGQLACATCHDPAHGYAGAGRQLTAAGQPNLRRAPALVNLAWEKAYAWDGRYGSIAELLAAHVRGQLGNDLVVGLARLASVPVYQAHFARDGGATPEVAVAALTAYVLTRYSGGAPWDRVERSPDAPADIKAGYVLFTGKAQCSVCHPPPLYTDLAYHRLGLIASRDSGRGRTDASQRGAFATPTLRGAAARAGFFHDGSAATLDAAIDWHLAGGSGQGAAPTIVDPALHPVRLTPTERTQLGAFVRALTPTEPPPAKPVLP